MTQVEYLLYEIISMKTQVDTQIRAVSLTGISAEAILDKRLILSEEIRKHYTTDIYKAGRYMTLKFTHRTSKR
jgi:hypothetical protein